MKGGCGKRSFTHSFGSAVGCQCQGIVQGPNTAVEQRENVSCPGDQPLPGHFTEIMQLFTSHPQWKLVFQFPLSGDYLWNKWSLFRQLWITCHPTCVSLSVLKGHIQLGTAWSQLLVHSLRKDRLPIRTFPQDCLHTCEKRKFAVQTLNVTETTSM